jgi:hypothetical protein
LLAPSLPAPRRTLANVVFTAIRRRAPELTAALAGFCWFLAIGGYRALPPTSLDWLGGGDWAQHVMGWLFFRRSRWALPLGRIDGFVWPSGTTVGFTDSNPLLALTGKLFSPLLPLDFQYVGLWLAACFALQGWFGARLTGLVSARPIDRALGGTMFALAPPLLERLGHDTLCAHFALLAMLLLHLQPVEHLAAARRALRAAVGVVALLAAVHPYLSVMALVLSFALVAKLALVDRLLRPGMAWRWALVLVVAQAAVLGVLGFFTSAPSHGEGFGLFSTDLLALVNPMGKSWVLPTLPVQVGQWEGNAYLGLGGLALAVIALLLALALRRRPRWAGLTRLLPLAIACALLFAFALSDVVRAAGHPVLDLRALYRPLKGLVGPLRSSGRFVWPSYYLVLTALVSARDGGARGRRPPAGRRPRPRRLGEPVRRARLAAARSGLGPRPRPLRPPRARPAAGGGRMGALPRPGLRRRQLLGSARVPGVRPGHDRQQRLRGARVP